MNDLYIIPWTFTRDNIYYLTFCTFSFEFKESSMSDRRCLIQDDVVSPHFGDKRMARR